MIPEPAEILISDRRRRGVVGEVAASLRRHGSDRRYGRWSVAGVLMAVAIPIGFVGVIWILVRSIFGG